MKRMALIFAVLVSCLATSCIEPPLRLPAQDIIVDMPIVITDMELVWDIEKDWEKEWVYGWDEMDELMFGSREYPEPYTYEVRRYFLGDNPKAKHTNVDKFTIDRKTFRRTYSFGYYDMLLWSNIYSPEGVQVVTIDESDLDNVTASTTITHSLSLRGKENPANALYNQPEVFYSAYPREIYISHYKEDYDEYDEVQKVWIKHIKTDLTPLVYIYLLQIILTNNDGRVRNTNGNCAISAFASGTSVNTGHTFDDPCMVYFNSRMKKGLTYKGLPVDVIGSKFTTYGLCDMEGYKPKSKGQYTGTRGELPNYLYFELEMASGAIVPLTTTITEQCQKQCHGGVITVIIDCSKIPDPGTGGTASAFNPTVDDYDELEFDIPI